MTYEKRLNNICIFIYLFMKNTKNIFSCKTYFWWIIDEQKINFFNLVIIGNIVGNNEQNYFCYFLYLKIYF
jgi:hypothetical protein